MTGIFEAFFRKVISRTPFPQIFSNSDQGINMKVEIMTEAAEKLRYLDLPLVGWAGMKAFFSGDFLGLNF